MNIYLKEISGGRSRFTFPSLPESIKVKEGANYQSFSIIGKGSVKIPKGTDASSITWSGEFFGRAKRGETIVKRWTAPEECVETLKDWMDSGTALNLMVTETDLNMDVTIANFEHERYGAYGNIRYTITLTEHRPLCIRTVDELGMNGPGDTSGRSDEEGAADGVRTHTVASGDNLWKIARQYYGGDGSDWGKIYDENRDAIESAARQHGRQDSNRGHYIYPGQVLIIP